MSHVNLRVGGLSPAPTSSETLPTSTLGSEVPGSERPSHSGLCGLSAAGLAPARAYWRTEGFVAITSSSKPTSESLSLPS